MCKVHFQCLQVATAGKKKIPHRQHTEGRQSESHRLSFPSFERRQEQQQQQQSVDIISGGSRGRKKREKEEEQKTSHPKKVLEAEQEEGGGGEKASAARFQIFVIESRKRNKTNSLPLFFLLVE